MAYTKFQLFWFSIEPEFKWSLMLSLIQLFKSECRAFENSVEIIFERFLENYPSAKVEEFTFEDLFSLFADAKVISKLKIKDKMSYNWDYQKVKWSMNVCWEEFKASEIKAKPSFCCYICDKVIKCASDRLEKYIDSHVQGGGHRANLADLCKSDSNSIGYCFSCKIPIYYKKDFFTHFEHAEHFEQLYLIAGFSPDGSVGSDSEDYSDSECSRSNSSSRSYRKQGAEEMVIVSDDRDNGRFPYIFTVGRPFDVKISVKNTGDEDIIVNACKVYGKAAVSVRILGNFPRTIFPEETKTITARLYSSIPLTDLFNLNIHLGKNTICRKLSVSVVE